MSFKTLKDKIDQLQEFTHGISLELSQVDKDIEFITSTRSTVFEKISECNTLLDIITNKIDTLKEKEKQIKAYELDLRSQGIKIFSLEDELNAKAKVLAQLEQRELDVSILEATLSSKHDEQDKREAELISREKQLETEIELARIRIQNIQDKEKQLSLKEQRLAQQVHSNG